MKSTFHQKFTAKHQNGGRLPINLQPRVTAELERLQNEGHIEKLSRCSDKHFISPIMITVKKDQSIKLALDSKVLNKALHKNKYQMLIDKSHYSLQTIKTVKKLTFPH